MMDNTASNATNLDGDIFGGSGGGQAPDTSHTDTEETSNGEELLEGLNEARTKRKGGNDEEINDQRPLSTKSVRDETENDLRMGVRGIRGKQVNSYGSGGTKQQGGSDGHRLFREGISGKRDE